MKFKTIKNHIIVVTLTAVMLPVMIIGCFSAITSYTSTTELVETNMQSTASLAADRISWELQSYQNISIQAGCNGDICDPGVSVEQKRGLLATISEQYGMTRGNLVDSTGLGIDGNDYSQREYFIQAMKGNSWISEPLISKVTGAVTIIVAAPVWENGIAGSTPIGCVYFVPDEEFLNDIMRSINFSENSVAYMIDKDGNTIAHIDSDIVKNGENIEEEAKSITDDDGYATLANVHSLMRNGETGFTDYTIGGANKYMGYAPIPDSNGWSVAVYAPAKDFLEKTTICVIITLCLMAVTAIASVISATRIGNSVGNPIKVCTDRIEKLSTGDLTSPVPTVSTQDETFILANATTTLVDGLNSMISDIERVLDAMAKGDFNVDTDNDAMYSGDFHQLIESAREIKSRLSGTLTRINTSADQVSNGSDQVSDGAQALSQGAAEQASSIEELAATIHTISAKVNENTESCNDGKALVQETADYISKASQEMDNLTDAMNEIGTASEEISGIIKAIEDISFQTNILALNAAVEAARAGEAGKGFAVVADEVRNLASKSADAAQETATLIEKAIEAVKNGTKITADTVNAVAAVEERSDKVNKLMDKIAEASVEQSAMISQVTTGMEQISKVVQTNSATAEQSAAASEELSGQASMLKELVGKFKL